jgi:hypothetical protein
MGLTLDFPNPVRDVVLFPGASDAMEIVNIATLASGPRADHDVRFGRRSLGGVSPSSLPLLVAYTDADGVRRSIELELPPR